MTDPQHDALAEAFARLIEAAPDRREVLLGEIGDDDLRRRLARLIDLAEAATRAGPLANEAIEARRRALEMGEGAQSVTPGSAVAGYVIERLLGEGGMGSVYMATQDRPARRVALKLVKSWIGSERALRRFELESETLGRLRHPGIAQIYEAGLYEGRPFFAMEYVDGPTLTEYADGKKLGTRERLKLIARIAGAVQHAHQRGVIHRDLKPSNILVTEVESDGGQVAQPKVLDFGVAKVTESDVRATTMQTGIGQLIGTIAYMSPEQASGDPAAIDTRSDVYALGVLAFELLTGRLPHDLQDRMVHEAVRMIREDEPSRLSSIDRALRGDIETIISKALEKAPERRYASASAFAADIGRYLEHQPLKARPASTWYQLRKFSRRNRVLVSGVAATFVMLVAGVIGTTLFAVRADAARAGEAARADELQRVTELQGAQLFGIDVSAMGSDIRRSILEAVDEDERGELDAPLSDVGFTGIAVQALDNAVFERAIAAIHDRFEDEPRLRARLLDRIGRSLFEMGLIEASLDPLRDAADLWRQQQGEDGYFQQLNTRLNLAHARVSLGQTSGLEAELLSLVDGFGALSGPEAEPTLRAIAVLTELHRRDNELDKAESLARETLEIERRTQGAEDIDAMATASMLTAILSDSGNFEEATTLATETLAAQRRVLGDDHEHTLITMSYLAGVLIKQGRYAEGAALAREVSDRSRAVLGDEHPSTLRILVSLGVAERELGQYAEAEQTQRNALAGLRRTLGDRNEAAITALSNLGLSLSDQGKLDEAATHLRRAKDLGRDVLGEEHTMTRTAAYNLAYVLDSLGEYAEAEAVCRETLEVQTRMLGEDHIDTLLSVNMLGTILESRDLYDGAGEAYGRALEGQRRVLGDRHPDTLVTASNLSGILKQQGKIQEALVLRREVWEGFSELVGADHPYTLITLYRLVSILIETEAFEEAEQRALDCERLNRARFGDQHSETTDAVDLLVNLYEAWHERAPEAGHDLKAAAWRDRAAASGGSASDE